MFKCNLIVLFSLLTFSMASGQSQRLSISSPDKKIQVQVSDTPSQGLTYTVKYNGEMVIEPSPLGLTLSSSNFRELKFVSASVVKKITDQYVMSYAKKSPVHYQANQQILSYSNAAGELMKIVFQVSDDAVAFRYDIDQKNNAFRQVKEELTAFNFPQRTRTWLQPMQVAKSGWEQSNPAYEEHYNVDVAVEDVPASKTGWVYPALFKVASNFVLITEAGLDSNYCATHLSSAAKPGNFTIGFPDPREVITGKPSLPQSSTSFSSPWRVIAIGSLAAIIESTAGTDLAKASTLKDKGFVKPGKASWSWINSKDDFIVYEEQKKYIDFAAEMNWQYCLVDADWDRKIGYEKIKELSAYAKAKNVGLLLWYNSAGDWNTVKYTPRNLLLTKESRNKEFARLRDMGIKGVKIDFFAGDGQSVIKYYIDILNDAAAYGLLVNFHGATLPRGWARTYPHLLTVEAVRGFENVTFNQKDADREAEICTVLPFTRNAFDPMDYTPLNLYKVPTKVQRKTSPAFQLALSVVFLSGIQHFAESPEGMAHVPQTVQDFLRTLPVRWDEVKYIDGFPGKNLILARRAGSKWYIAGINNDEEKQLSLKPSLFGKKRALLYTDGVGNQSFDVKQMPITKDDLIKLDLKPAQGFVLVVE